MQKCFSIICLWLMVFSGIVQGENAEYVQKRKIVAHILQTVSWPAKSINNHALHVCLLGQFAEEACLQGLHGTTINHQNIVVRKLSNIADGKKGCNLIYISKSEAARMKTLIAQFANRPVLLLGDMDAFAAAGGSMNFTLLNEVLAITINTESLQKSNLKLKLNPLDQVTIFPDEDALPI